MLALTDASTITISIVGFFTLVAVFVALRVLLRREPSPATWLRFRMGVFIERDPKDRDDQPPA